MYLVFARMPSESYRRQVLKKKKEKKDVPLVEFMYPVFTRMSCESYGRRLRSLLCLCDDLRALINSLVR